MGAHFLHPRSKLCEGAFTRQHHCFYAHCFKEREGEPPLYEVLRLIVQIRLAAPADDEDTRDAVDLLMQQREQRVDNVAETAVLQVDERHLARRKVIARRECRRAALVHRDDVRGTVRTVGVHEMIDERAQLRVRYAREELRAERREKIRYVHRYSNRVL